jgi:hypothetical protein
MLPRPKALHKAQKLADTTLYGCLLNRQEMSSRDFRQFDCKVQTANVPEYLKTDSDPSSLDFHNVYLLQSLDLVDKEWC